MFNILDSETWVDIVQDLEATDPLLGGADGHLTKASQSLANRTLWLKAQIEALFTADTLVYNSERLGGLTKQELINSILGGAGTAYDTLLELQNEIQENDGDISGILTTLSSKADLSSFENNKVSAGYQKFPNGLILQWGSVSTLANNSVLEVLLPISFPTNGLQVVTSMSGSGSASYNIGMAFKDPSTINLTCSHTVAVGTRYIAIGH